MGLTSSFLASSSTCTLPLSCIIPKIFNCLSAINIITMPPHHDKPSLLNKKARTGIPGSGAFLSAHESHVSIIYDYRKILNIKTSTNPTAHAMVDVMEYVIIWSFTSPTPSVRFTTQK